MTLLGWSSLAAAMWAAQPPGGPPGGVPLPMRKLFSEQNSGIQERRRDVIRSAAQWRVIEDALGRARPSAPPLPVVDFTRSMVILVAMGQRSTAGHTIAIEAVPRQGGRLWVVVNEVSPGSGRMTAQVLTTPACAVSVPLSDEPVSFVERAETQDDR